MKRTTEAELEQREATARDQLGLTAAHRGDEDGVRRFAYLTEHEVSNLAYFSPLPDAVKHRMTILARELRDLKNFMDGRLSIVTKPKK